jgi:S1-C subfamily serine protease
LKVGDDIMSVNGHPAGDYIELNRTLRESQKMMIDLSVAREGELRDVQVRMLPFAELFRQRLGVDLQELTSELVNQLGLQRVGGMESGLLVSRVEKGGPAEKALLQEYFVINGIGGHPVRNFLDAFLALSELKKSAQTELDVLTPVTRGNVILGYQPGQTNLRLR